MSQIICVLYGLPPQTPEGEIMHLQFINDIPSLKKNDIHKIIILK